MPQMAQIKNVDSYRCPVVRKGGRSSWELERRRGERAAELQQWRRLLQLDGRGEKSVCSVLLTCE
jgi:hypothetical protein